MSSTHRNINMAAADALRILTVLDERMAVIRDAQRGQPGAQSFGDVRTVRTVTHCERHECDVAECREAGLFCNGVTIVVSDPTGEAALQGDRARDALRFLERKAQTAADVLDSIVVELNKWGPALQVTGPRGVGRCDECGRKCDGKDKRLRPAENGQDRLCDACRKRESRFKPTEAAS